MDRLRVCRILISLNQKQKENRSYFEYGLFFYRDPTVNATSGTGVKKMYSSVGHDGRPNF